MTLLTRAANNRRQTRLLLMIVSFIPLVCAVPAGSPSMAQSPSPASKRSSGDLVSSRRYKPPAAVKANGRLLIHHMPSVQGGMTRASTLLFVPKGKAPVGGWTVVAWAHGATTLGQKMRAPSLSPDLDGGLTADGFTSDYVYIITSLVNAGYAVVAPDLEGLGAIASVPHPHFNAISSARSLIAGVRAARRADRQLSSRLALVGHSDGGRAVLAVEAFAAEAPELSLKGTVALAPFTSIDATVSALGELALKTPDKITTLAAQQNLYVAAMATGLLAQSPSYNPGSVMGADLQNLLPTIKSKGLVEATALITQAVTSKTTEGFLGFKAQWSKTPEMKAFLAANDPAVTPGFTLRLPTLIVQGTKDGSVLEPLAAAFSSKLIESGAPVTYRTYEGADHFTVIRKANTDMLAFLKEILAEDGEARGTKS